MIQLSARSRRAREAHDYKGMENMKQIFKDEVEWCPDPVARRRRRRCGRAADRLAAVHDASFPQNRRDDEQPIIFDGRNCLHRDVMRETGFQYYPMGRPAVENTLRLKQKV